MSGGVFYVPVVVVESAEDLDSEILNVVNQQILNDVIPSTDVPTNVLERDVIGSKSDTSSGTSLVSLAKGIKYKTDNLPTDPTSETNATTNRGIVTSAIASATSSLATETNATNNKSSIILEVDTRATQTSVDTANTGITTIVNSLPVPVQNAVTNANMRDVIGNKTDTSAGTSIVSRLVSAQSSLSSILGDLAIPTADNSANILERDVIGNKTDSVAGTSIYSKLLVAIADLTTLISDMNTPTQNATANVLIRDVIGNKTDDETNLVGLSGDPVNSSISAKSTILFEHTHHKSNVYPSNGNGGSGWNSAINVISSATAGTVGTFAILIPINVISLPFDIHRVFVESLSGGTYSGEIILSTTADMTGEIGRIRIARDANTTAQSEIIQTSIVPANSQIYIGLIASTAGAKTLGISVYYHVY